MHRVPIDTIPQVGQSLDITGDEARHAVRVKRLEPGEPVELLDGRGCVARAIVEPGHRSPSRAGSKAGGEWTLTVRVEHVEQRPRIRPLVHVRSAVPKGERLEAMIDALSQIGAASWGPLECVHSVAEPRPHRLDRLERIAREAAKQCGRAWALELADPITLEAALTRPAPVLIADASGTPLDHTHVANSAGHPDAQADHDASITLLVGPEGGWDPRELDKARAANAPIVSFGPHILRIEQACAIGTAIALHLGR